ncbi:hypothetical protein BDP27DRAFT_985676 [Rhodocollybia butyracea]|uniref:Secreted protein n=1 Tax=Rhodocollybia butyracea TaxID=206335 RepID=A0A9P5U596_9AGAR|nr:hypothetical protein BDP27DRAFT_985676 [Rhodocollybia butyracea]
MSVACALRLAILLYPSYVPAVSYTQLSVFRTLHEESRRILLNYRLFLHIPFTWFRRWLDCLLIHDIGPINMHVNKIVTSEVPCAVIFLARCWCSMALFCKSPKSIVGRKLRIFACQLSKPSSSWLENN